MASTSFRRDETYIKGGNVCTYLYRTVDKEGNTTEFMLSAKRDVFAAKRFFKKMMRRITEDFHSQSVWIRTQPILKHSLLHERRGGLPGDCKLRRAKNLNNIIEQDHRFIKKRMRA
jgi:transposase-like protein